MVSGFGVEYFVFYLFEHMKKTWYLCLSLENSPRTGKYKPKHMVG
jgi:hypothetical protein